MSKVLTDEKSVLVDNEKESQLDDDEKIETATAEVLFEFITNCGRMWTKTTDQVWILLFAQSMCREIHIQELERDGVLVNFQSDRLSDADL